MESYLDKLTEEILRWLLTGSLRILIIVIASMAAYYLLKKLISKIVKVAVTPGDGEDRIGEQQREDTLIHIFTITLKMMMLIISGLMVATEFGLKIAPLLAGAGVLGLALSFGGQHLIKDVISGLFIILENQYRINDSIQIANLTGKVERITLRLTTLRDIDGNIHHIPNGEIKTVSNFSKTFSRVNLDVGIGYGSDINKVAEIVNKVGIALSEDPDWKDKLITPPQFLRVQKLGDSSVVIKILGDTKPSEQWAVAGELRKRIYEAFNQNHIDIPFPQTVVHLRNDKKE